MLLRYASSIKPRHTVQIHTGVTLSCRLEFAYLDEAHFPMKYEVYEGSCDRKFLKS